MSLRRVSELIVTAVAAGGLGWFAAGAGGGAEPELSTSARPAPGPVKQAAAAPPLVLVARDGNVTLRVEQQPLEWVLDELARQTGWNELKARGAAMKASPTASGGASASASAGVACEPPAQPAHPAPQAQALLATIQRGAEPDRWQALITARSEGVAVSPATLRTLYETDGSDRVRLEAFETYLEVVSHDRAKTRAVLEEAANLPTASLQREARARLQQLADAERGGATAQGVPP